MLARLTTPDLQELIAEGKLAEVRGVLDTWLPADLAAAARSLRPDEQVTLFTTLSPEIAAQVFEHLDIDLQERLLAELPEPLVAHIINAMSADDRTRLLERVPPEQRNLLLSLLTAENFAVAQNLLSYGEDTVGLIMTPDFITVRAHWTVAQVLDFIRAPGKDRETLNVFYVVDDANRLI